MADAIVQTIKVQVEGTEEAAAEFKKVGDAGSEAFKRTQQAASESGPAVAEAGKQASAGLASTGAALDETTKKAGLSRREMSALGKVMAAFGGGEIAGAAVGLSKVASALGVLGAAALAVGLAGKALYGFGEAAKAAAEEGEKLSRLTANTGQQIQTLAAVFEKGGTSTKAFADSTGKLVEELSKLAAVRGLSPDAAKSMTDAANDADVLKRKLLDLATATQQWPRSLNDAGKAVKDWGKETIDPLTTPAALAKAIKAAFLELPGAIKNGKPDMDKFYEFLNRTFNRLDAFGQLQLGEALKQLGIPPEIIATITKTTEEYDKLKLKMQDPLFLKQREAARNFAEGLDEIKQSAGELGVSIGASVVTSVKGINQDLEAIKAAFRNMDWHELLAAPSFQALASLGEALTKAGEAVVAFATTAPANAWAWIAETFNSVVTGPLKSAADAVTQFIASWVTTPIASAWQWIVDAWNAMLAKLGFGGGQPAPATSGGSGFARGGLLGGRGSGTSDSNLAWVSRGEFIVPAHAVRAPGVLNFLEALRLAGGNLRGLLDGMHFAAGGLIMPRAVPAFAGSAGGGRNWGSMTLNFADGTSITGMTDERIAEGLRRVAVSSQIRSGGRKPSRYS